MSEQERLEQWRGRLRVATDDIVDMLFKVDTMLETQPTNQELLRFRDDLVAYVDTSNVAMETMTYANAEALLEGLIAKSKELAVTAAACRKTCVRAD